VIKTTDVLLIVLLPLFGCAAGPGVQKDCTPPTPTADNQAELVVYRPHMLYGSLIPYRIAVDDCTIGDLEDDSLIRYKVAAGKRQIHTKDAAISSEFKPGTTTYVRFWMVNTGKVQMYFHGRIYEHVPKLALVDKATAVEEIKSLKKPEE